MRQQKKKLRSPFDKFADRLMIKQDGGLPTTVFALSLFTKESF